VVILAEARSDSRRPVLIRPDEESPIQVLHNRKLNMRGQIFPERLSRFDRFGINADYFVGKTTLPWRAVVSFWHSPTHLFSGHAPCRRSRQMNVSLFVTMLFKNVS
jgi:hypothetical protein